jgi:Skp family chaperone for outer membrane proteins
MSGEDCIVRYLLLALIIFTTFNSHCENNNPSIGTVDIHTLFLFHPNMQNYSFRAKSFLKSAPDEIKSIQNWQKERMLKLEAFQVQLTQMKAEKMHSNRKLIYSLAGKPDAEVQEAWKQWKLNWKEKEDNLNLTIYEYYSNEKETRNTLNSVWNEIHEIINLYGKLNKVPHIFPMHHYGQIGGPHKEHSFPKISQLTNQFRQLLSSPAQNMSQDSFLNTYMQSNYQKIGKTLSIAGLSNPILYPNNDLTLEVLTLLYQRHNCTKAQINAITHALKKLKSVYIKSTLSN